MPNYIDPDQLKRKILSDMRVELAEEFDRNFERKKFFTDEHEWKPRRIDRRGSLQFWFCQNCIHLQFIVLFFVNSISYNKRNE